MKEIRTCSQEDTIEFGKKLGVLLKKGDIVCITGDLGTGKTVLTNGIASALGIDEYITSPTFTIVNEYEKGDISLYHFDVYRISDPIFIEQLFYRTTYFHWCNYLFYFCFIGPVNNFQ